MDTEEPTLSRKKKLARLALLVLPDLLGLTLVLGRLYAIARPIIAAGVPLTHSTGSNLVWLMQYIEQRRGGQLFPRWLEASNVGLGSPTLHFYPPMFLWGTRPFALFGVRATSQLVGTSLLALLVLALGVTFYVRRIVPGRRGTAIAWAAGIIAASTPYACSNAFVRGALAELWAMAWIPWWLLAADVLATHVRERRDLAGTVFRVIGLAFATATIAFSHLPTLLIACTAFLVLAIARLFSDTGAYRELVAQGVAGALGLGLASIFLMPAALDQGLVSIEVILGMKAPEHLMVDGIAVFSPAVPSGFQHIYVPQVLAILSVCIVSIVCFARAKSLLGASARAAVVQCVIVTLLALYMMSDLARGFYYRFPTYQNIQFAWRWLSVSSVLVPVQLAVMARYAIDTADVERRTIRIGVLCIAALAIGTTAEMSTIFHVNLQAPAVARFDHFVRRFDAAHGEPPAVTTGAREIAACLYADDRDDAFIVDVAEYTPKGAVRPTPTSVVRAWPRAAFVTGTGTLRFDRYQTGYRRLRVQASAPATVALRAYAWPGFEARVDGRVVATTKTREGRIVVPVPRGRHVVELRYVGTHNQHRGERVSLAATVLAGLAALFAIRARRRAKTATTDTPVLAEARV